MSSSAIADGGSRTARHSGPFAAAAVDGRRLSGLAFGVGTQALFLITVVGLFSFLRYGVAARRPDWLITDFVLALQFAVPHSVLLHPRVRRWLKPLISGEMYGSFFCVWTCLSLLLTFHFWRSSGIPLWDLTGTAATMMLSGFFLSWAALLYSISLTGFGYQTGWTQWLCWYQRRPLPRRDFHPRSAYHILRHPVYLSFLGLIWFTPVMTTDHAMLTGLWSVYIFMGSVFKDRRLQYFLGTDYERYMQQVPGYPLIPGGPLARQRLPDGTSRCSS